MDLYSKKISFISARATVLFALVLSLNPQIHPEVPHTVTATGQQGSMKVADFYTALKERVSSQASEGAMNRDFQEFKNRRGLGDDYLYTQYVGVKVLFECTRDAGLWGIQWNITNQEPDSKRIWSQWQKRTTLPPYSEPTAIAECDEISALFCFLAKKIGIRNTGLLYPTWNHTVAVWFPKVDSKKEIRVIVPTTQIFLKPNDYFDTNKFEPWRRKTLWEYTPQDVPDTYTIPKLLAEHFLSQIDKYCGASEKTLQKLRYLRDAVFRHQMKPEQTIAEVKKIRVSFSSPPSPDARACDYFVADISNGKGER